MKEWRGGAGERKGRKKGGDYYMKILDWIKEGHICQGCGEFFPKAVLINFVDRGVYCTVCAQEIDIDEMEA